MKSAKRRVLLCTHKIKKQFISQFIELDGPIYNWTFSGTFVPIEAAVQVEVYDAVLQGIRQSLTEHGRPHEDG